MPRCSYLGLSLSTSGSLGPFEPDPAKWPANVGGHGSSSDAKVWFEWLHVQRGSSGALKPHRVSMLVRTANARARTCGDGESSVWDSAPECLQRKVSATELDRTFLINMKYNGHFLKMTPEAVIGMLSEMRVEKGRVEPMPGKHDVINALIADITSGLAKGDVAPTKRAPMEKMLADLKAMQKDRLVDELLYRKTIDLIEEGAVDKSTLLPTARAILRTHLQTMKTHHLSPEEHLRCNAILELDNEFARMLDVENDGDEEMLQLRAAFSNLSTAPSSSGHGGHSQQRKRKP